MDPNRRPARAWGARGSDTGTAKLTEEQVSKIKRSLLHGERVIDLAAQYNVSKGTIYNIKIRRTWVQVAPAPEEP